MKKTVTLLALFLFAFSVGAAQPVAGKRFEFSTAASILVAKYKGEGTETTINVPVRLGIFLHKGLEIEPELLLTVPEEGIYAGYLFSVNVLYNLKVSKEAMPFVLAGYGHGNSQDFFGVAFDQEKDTDVYHLGAGVKWLWGDKFAMRFEYRFSKYSGEKTEEYALGRRDHKVFMGFSVFF